MNGGEFRAEIRARKQGTYLVLMNRKRRLEEARSCDQYLLSDSTAKEKTWKNLEILLMINLIC
jgi:hypothetical protein